MPAPPTGPALRAIDVCPHPAILSRTQEHAGRHPLEQGHADGGASLRQGATGRFLLAEAAELIARLSEAAVANTDRIQEMEFNPIILHGDGTGVSVADALVVLKDGK